MEHYYKEIQGWFDYEILYSTIVRLANFQAHFVEIGSWKGRSSSFMGVEIINSGKRIQFDCVDTWEGSNEDCHQDDPSLRAGTLYLKFLENIDPVSKVIRAIKMASVPASMLYADGSLDFVFIDASHEYVDVKQDIRAWMPKVKVGGVFAGHDYMRPGVNRAVQELIPNAVAVDMNPCWMLQRTPENSWRINI